MLQQLLLLLSGVVPAVASSTYQLGLYGPMTSVNLDYFIAGVMFDVDFRKNSESALVTAYGPPIVNIASLNAGLKGNVALQIANSNSVASEGMGSALDFLQGLNGRTKIDGLIGGYHSAITMPINNAAGWFKVPQISFASTSEKLSEKATYPWFLRTIPPDSIQAAGMWRFVKHTSIPAVTMIYATEAYAEGLMTSVSTLAAEAGESYRVSPVSVSYMATSYDSQTAYAAIDLALAGDSKIFLMAMTLDQWVQFMPLAANRGLAGTSYQLIGSEAMSFTTGVGIPDGYIKFAPVSQGDLWPDFETMWKKMTVEAVNGTAATSRYGLDLWYTGITEVGESVSSLSDDFFGDEHVSSIPFDVPYLFDAGYAFIAAANDLMNAGSSLDDVIANPSAVLTALKSISFTGVSGEVSFNSDGDRLASYIIENVQSGSVVDAMTFSASTDTISGSNLIWQNGETQTTVPSTYTACPAGYYTDSSTLLCAKCSSPLVATSDGLSCKACSFGLVAANHADGTRTCELYPIQLGMYGPFTSVTMDFLAMAVAFDLDFKKNHDDELATRFGPPVVAIDDLNSNLRVKLQIDNSNSDPEIGVAIGLAFCQGNEGRDKVVGIIGGYHSAISVPIANLATQYKVTQVSYASTSPALSDKDTYPYFLRTIPPDSIQGQGMWRYIKSFQIPTLTFIYTLESYGEGLYGAVNDLANDVNEGDRLSSIGIAFMTTYVPATAEAKLKTAITLGNKVILCVMTQDQGNGFWPVVASLNMLNGDYQFVGSEAMSGTAWTDILPAGYQWFSPVSQGALFDDFKTYWTQLLVDDLNGTEARSEYGLDVMQGSLEMEGAAVSLPSQSIFDSTDNLAPESPYLFDAGYSFVVAANSLINAGISPDSINGAALLAAVQAVDFTGISGKVKYNSAGDRLASYAIKNLQTVNSVLTGVTAALFDSDADAITVEAGQTYAWMDGTYNDTMPGTYTDCLSGYYKDVSYNCQPCGATMVTTADGTSCEYCAFGLVATDHDDGTRTCELYPIQLGMYGPLTSVTMDFLAMAVAFDLDFKKNHDSALAARFGPPIVSISDLNANLRVKLQIDNSNSDPEIGVAVGLAFCQGASGRDQVAGIIGGYHSSISVTVANLATQYKISQVSYASTSPALSEKSTYPYFLRTIPPDSIQGQGMWRYIKSFHLPTLTFIYALESYGEGLYGAVNDLANEADEADRISSIGITFMTTYVPATAEAKLNTAITLANKVIFCVMTADQGDGFWPVASSKGMLNGDYQFVGSEAIPGYMFTDVLPAGYQWFSPISQGSLFENFKTYWTQLLVDDLTGAEATEEYGLDIMLGPLDMDGAAVSMPTQSMFDSTDSLTSEAPYLFDAGYSFVVAANNLINSGTSPDEIKGAKLLAGLQAVDFTGISGKVKFNEDGDRLASYYIRNLQMVNGALSSVAAALFESDSDSITVEDGHTYVWMDGTASDSIPDSYTSCLSGFYKDENHNCQSCGASMVSNADGTGCESCDFGLVIEEDSESGARMCAYYPVQMGIYGPMTSVNMDYLIAAVAFDLDFRKNHDSELQARFGPPVVTVNNLHKNLRVKVQIGNSNSDPDEGVAINLEWFQGKNGRTTVTSLVGGYHSSISMLVTALATQFKIPQVSYASTSADLSNKDSYAYFSRTIPPDSIQGTAMWAFLKSYNVPSASIVYSQETYAQGLYNTVANLASDDGMSYRVVGVSISYMATNYDTEEAETVVKKAMSQSGKVIVMIMTLDQAYNFVPVAEAAGMFTEEWQVLGSEAVQYASIPELPAGYMYFNPESRGELFDSFSEYWSKLLVSDVLGDEAVKYYGLNLWSTTLNQSAVGLVTQDMLQTAADSAMEVPYLVDAAYTLVVAANAMMNAGIAPENFDGAEYLSQVREATFEGVSGSVAFDEKGDRLASYYIMNVQTSESSDRRLATKAAVLVAIYSAVSGDIEVQADQEFYWMTGTYSDALPSVLTACESGYYKDQDTLVCVKCMAGTYSPGGNSTTCTACPKGYRANAATGASGCVICAAGTYSESEGSVNCTSCSPGSYSATDRATECTMCAVGFYQSKTAATKCNACDANMETQVLGADTGDECKCSEGFYQINSDSACQACLEGMTCAFGSNMENYYGWQSGGRSEDNLPAFPVLQESYMSMPDDPLWVYECNVVARCPGGPPGTCGEGLEVVRSCAHCAENYHWTGTECSECTSFEGSGALFPILPLILGPPLLCLLYKLSRDDVDKWGSWRNAIATFGFLILNHYQVTTLCNNANLQLSSSVMSFLSTYSFAEDPSSLFKPDCAGYRSFTAQMAVKSASPIIIFFVLALTFAGSHLVKRLFNKEVAFDLNRTLNIYFSLMFTFFAGISAMALALFKCTPNPNQESTLSKDQSIVCYRDEWNSLVVIAIAAVVLYIFGFGGLFLRATIIAPNNFSHVTFQRRWKFLFIKFRPDVWWWALVICGKGVWMNIGFTFMTEGIAQLYWVMSAMGVYCMAVVYFMPWRHRAANGLDIYMHFALMFLCSLLAYYVHTDVDEDVEQRIAAAAIAVNITPVIVALALFAQLVHQHTHPKSHQTRVQTVKKLTPAMLLFANAPEEEIQSFMGKLDEWGYFHVISALHVISTEFCGERYKARLSDGTLKSSSSIGDKHATLPSGSLVVV